MTAGRRRQILARGRSLGYTGNNLGQLYQSANSIARGITAAGRTFTAAQKRTARSIQGTLSGSA
jgi:hypothetical protein